MSKTDPKEKPSNQFSAPTTRLVTETVLLDEIKHAATELSFRVLKYILLVVVGAVGALILQLNSKIYEAIGKQSQTEKYFEAKIKLDYLENENADLKKTIKCLEDSNVKNKQGCKYGY